MSLLSGLVVLLLLLLPLAGCGDVVVNEAPSSTAPSTTAGQDSPDASNGGGFVQQEGEIFLEPAGTAGPESFAGEVFVPAGPPSTLAGPVTPTSAAVSSTTTPGMGVQVASFAGDTPALYGGSKSKSLVDKEGQLSFLEQNPDKAAAFCAALNSDPTIRWNGGSQVRPDQLREYFAELTPIMLTRDIRVTNHGYRDGRPTPRQSVLQAGQMVLVDRVGVPRVRCECGNPLAPPQPVQTTPRYIGSRWPGFDPAVVIVIQQATTVIETFVLVDVHTGQTFDRPAGTTGAKDTAHEASVWRLDVEMTRVDATDERQNTISWTAEITVNPDGTLSGLGTGTFRSDGVTWSSTGKTGTFAVDASFSVNISGYADTTELGRFLLIQPALRDYAVDSVAVDSSGDEAAIRASIEEHVPEFIQDSFAELSLQAEQPGPVLASVSAGGYEGSATLTPVR